jgi:PAS domain S-box-containing protein
MVHCNDEQSLFQRICEVIVTLGGMELAWIGLVDSTTGMLTPVAHAGRGAEYVDGLQVSVRDDELGHGPSGLAVREDRAVWVDDFAHDPRTFPWQERGAVFGWTSTAAIPLRRNGVAIGTLSFYSRSREWFDDETKALLEAMATDISFALDSLHLQSTLVESEQRFRALVEQSIAGVYIVENRKIAYANPRFKTMFGYDVSDDLTGVDVASLMAPDDVAIAAEREQQFAGGAKRAEATLRGVKKDGGVVLVGSTTSRAVYQGREVLIGLAQDVSERHVAEAHIQRYAAQLEYTFIQAVGLVTTLSEMRDPYTAGHEERVAELAVAIGTELGLSHEQLKGLRVSGFLHDVGKISVPTEILVKPTHLNEFEAALMRQHPQAGYDVLKEVDFPWPVALVALQHHERIDGSGYPQGLKGEEILLESRIVAVADVVESMESHRPYRPALGIDAALAEIERGAGTLYDERAATACLRLYREKGYHPRVS